MTGPWDEVRPNRDPRRHLRLGLRFYFDTNFVEDHSDAATQLREYHRAGSVDLWRTDTVDTELASASDERTRRDLLDASAPYVESLGVAVVGHSRFDHSFVGDDADEARLDRVYCILFPNSDRHDTSTGRSRRKLRDAMHIATAVRYGCSGFITRDNGDLVPKAAAIEKAFGLRIMQPEQAVAFVERIAARYDARSR